MSSVECEGAPAVSGKVAGKKYIAQFNREDLVGVIPGEEVDMTVTGEFYYGIDFAGTDTIRVIQ
jgi:hypothetical protein